MKRLITILLIAVACTFSANAEGTKSDDHNCQSVSTAANGRFEFIQAPSNYKKAFLLDKYTGRIWADNGSFNEKIEEVEVEDRDSAVDTTRVNYQLYIHGDNYTRCFLLNIHTGDMWKCNTKRGKSLFEKIQMPWNK